MKPASLASASTGLLHSGDEPQSELDDLRVEALHSVLPSVIAGGFVLVFMMTLGLLPDNVTFKGLAVAFSLWGTCALSYLGLLKGIRLASASLIVGLMGSLLVLIYLFPNGVLACGFSIVVVIAGLLLGPSYGLATAVGSTAILLADSLGAGAIPHDVLVGALFLVWASAFLSWLTSRPLFDALDWSWSAYNQAQRKTEEARLRQAELVKLSRNLNEAYCRLESLNQRLNVAREAADQARRLKTEFASTVSHELRTPLNLIIGFSEMIIMAPQNNRESAIPDLYRGDVEAIYRNACHLSNLIDDILDLAQVEAHRMGLQREYTPLVVIAHEAVAGVATMYSERGLDLSLQIPADLPPVYVDRVRARQILINLLANAARFTEEGGVTVSASPEGEEVIVSVADTGLGIPAEDLPRVFQEFSRLDSESARKHSGLGLAICKRFVELHGGHIWVESKRSDGNGAKQHGTTFRFTLPTTEVEVGLSPDDRPLLVRADRVERSEPNKTVVVIGGNSEVPKLFRRYLDGCEIIHAETVEEAKQISRDKRPKIALTSVPRTAIERHQLKEYSSTLPDVPVVSYRLSGPWDAQCSLGVAGFLLKPVTADQLRLALAKLSTRIGSIMVVDDDPEMVDLLSAMVMSACPGCRVSRAGNGQAALDLLEESRPDVMLLDLSMPGLDGPGVLQHLQASPRWRDLPVIVVTAHGPHDGAVGATELRLTRACGLQVGELMRCLQAMLGALEEPEPTAEGLPIGRWGALAWLGIPPPPETTPERPPGELSRR